MKKFSRIVSEHPRAHGGYPFSIHKNNRKATIVVNEDGETDILENYFIGRTAMRSKKMGWDRKEKIYRHSVAPKWLHSRIGQPWSKVYSEFVQKFSGDTWKMVCFRDYVIKHLVAVDPILVKTPFIDVNGEKSYETIAQDSKGASYEFYVCPDTGVLKRIQPNRISRKRRSQARAKFRDKVYRLVSYETGQSLHKVDGIWYEFRAIEYPAWSGPKQACTHAAFNYGSEGYVFEKRQLSTGELQIWKLENGEDEISS